MKVINFGKDNYSHNMMKVEVIANTIEEVLSVEVEGYNTYINPYKEVEVLDCEDGKYAFYCLSGTFKDYLSFITRGFETHTHANAIDNVGINVWDNNDFEEKKDLLDEEIKKVEEGFVPYFYKYFNKNK